MQFTMSSEGVDGNLKLFEKPAFAVFNIFAAMSFVLIIHYLQAGRQPTESRTDSCPKPGNVLEPEFDETSVPKKMSEMEAFLYIGIPATFDLAGSGLTYMGLLYVSASVWQILRGSMIVFSALISMLAIGKKLYSFHWFGIFTCVIGICCVGGANVLNTSGGHARGDNTVGDAWFGMGLVILGQVLIASQFVSEEKLLKDMKLPPMQIVGFEGVWGVIQMVVVVFPILRWMPGSDNGSVEDWYDSAVMLHNSPALLGLVCVVLFSCATYNMSGMAVTNLLSAVHRSMLEATRTAVIWVYGLGVHYFFSDDAGFGESWMPYSWLQLVGFGFLVCGQMIYSETLVIPCLTYPPPKAAGASESSAARENNHSPMPSPQGMQGNLDNTMSTP
jgi:drug/metabolite transporter (DMT)-like permease